MEYNGEHPERLCIRSRQSVLAQPANMPSSSTIISQRPLHFSSSTSANESRRPCTNCLKKSRVDLCKYAPKPVKDRQPKSMAARLKRLEGMVREMLDEDGNVPNPSSSERTAVGEDDIDSGGDIDAGKFASSASGGQVIRGAGARGGNTTYVGATHFMAMLGDVCVTVLLTMPYA